MFLSRNDRLLGRYKKEVKLIRDKAVSFSSLTDEQIGEKFQSLKEDCTQKGFVHVRSSAVALVVLAVERSFDLIPFDVQIVGALALLDGKIAQMKTGEGKTLTASIAALARSVEGRGSHVVTVNEYLVKRDSAQTRKIGQLLGQTVGFVYSGQDHADKKISYFSDVTYGTNSEIGFDFLRSNMTLLTEEGFMRDLHFAIVDEVDSILIDEARTPLIISEQSQTDSILFYKINDIAKVMERDVSKNDASFSEEAKNKLESVKEGGAISLFHSKQEENGDFVVDEKKKSVHVTERGFETYENLLKKNNVIPEDDNLCAVHNLGLIYHLEAAIKAHHLFRNNIDYIIRDNKVFIVDEFTGRVLEGRRWSYGIHQAIEAKEGLEVEDETRTAASITLQNLFREYKILSGMTGTAKTEAGEFYNIYGLEVVEIATNRPMIRKDYHDAVFLSHEGKISAILDDIIEKFQEGRPVLVGTTTVEMSEFLSEALTAQKIPHQVLNAKQHEKEAHIIAQAGKSGSVTIATNMAGRGTDIILGGSVEEERELSEDLSEEEIKKRWQENHDNVVRLGGLHVIGTERHESRRIDDQLRGRAGRQGDPGSSKFYISFDDDLMRLFAGRWVQDTLRVIGMKQDQVIDSSIVTKQIEKAQRAIENQNFDMRKQLLDYDNVSNEQRRHLYGWRRWVKRPENQKEYVNSLLFSWVSRKIKNFFAQKPLIAWEETELHDALNKMFSPAFDLDTSNCSSEEEIVDKAVEGLTGYILDKDPEMNNTAQTILHEIDLGWREHLAQLDLLRKGIHLRGFVQKDPKQEYKKESYLMFEAMVNQAEDDAFGNILQNKWVVLASRTKPKRAPVKVRRPLQQLLKEARALYGNPSYLDLSSLSQEEKNPHRNSLCSCGSGKKFKHCHGTIGGSADNKPLFKVLSASHPHVDFLWEDKDGYTNSSLSATSWPTAVSRRPPPPLKEPAPKESNEAIPVKKKKWDRARRNV